MGSFPEIDPRLLSFVTFDNYYHFLSRQSSMIFGISE